MEEIAGRYEHHFFMNRSIQLIQKEIWAKHYSSNHQILLVGEGDFSFALSLAVSFGSGFNIVASSFDSYARLLFKVDARKMVSHNDLYLRKFDRIVYNFPHAELASQSCLTLLECVEFKLEDYPGYNNKRGDGLRSDKPFPLGECCTFKFISSSTATISTQKEIWVKHYSSNHQILLVGEGDFSFALSLADSFRSGDFSFALSLADSFRSGFNIVASSIDSRARLLFGVDACTMEFHSYLHLRKFDRIVYNFPHAVHVSHKTTFPFDCWNIVELASQSCLKLLECVEFKREDYPGYNNKRGDGVRSDEPFPLGECRTYKFISSSTALYHGNHQELQEIRLQGANTSLFTDPARAIDSTECFRIFVEYFDHARSTCGKNDCYLSSSVRDHLRFGFQRYMAEDHRRQSIDFVKLLEELRSLSKQRIEFLQKRLWELDLRG
ncbi:protein of unknown function DUF2431, partial [Cynara cardunculus var. scolymus]